MTPLLEAPAVIGPNCVQTDPKCSAKNQLIEGRVEYMDGTEASVEQMAHDVTQFLAWSAEPKMEARKSLGIAVLGYLFGFALLLYLSYRQIWRNVQH